MWTLWKLQRDIQGWGAAHQTTDHRAALWGTGGGERNVQKRG